jgi:integrase
MCQSVQTLAQTPQDTTPGCKKSNITWYTNIPTSTPAGKHLDARRSLHPDVIDRILRKYARHIGLDRGYSAHSMRATFITTALDNGASLEDVQTAAGHADPSTTKLYDRRGYNPALLLDSRVVACEDVVY